MFDCVLPTRNGRHGAVFTRFGQINLSNARHRDDPRPLDEQSPYETTRTYSRAYLHHLVRVNEMLGAMLLSAINLAYYHELMAGMRSAIRAGEFCRIPGPDPRRLGQGRPVACLDARYYRREGAAARSGRNWCRSGWRARFAS